MSELNAIPRGEIEQAWLRASPASWAAAATSGAYQTPPHVRAIDTTIMELIEGRLPTDILIVEAPPRHGKSELISKWLPAWYLGRFPDRCVLLASYEAHFAASWGRKARSLLREYGPRWWNVTVGADRHAASDWTTLIADPSVAAGAATEASDPPVLTRESLGNRGGMATAGVGGPLTGRGAHLLVIDDYMKNAEHAMSQLRRDAQWDWWQSTSLTRLEPGGVAIIMATRWHHDDLIGRVLKQAEDDNLPVARVRLPALAEEDDLLDRKPGEALWPERWPLESLKRTRKRLQRHWWLSLYQQRPGRHARAEWPEDYFSAAIWAEEWPDAFEWAVVGIDPSKGNTRPGDYFAAVFLGLAGGLMWVDAVLERRKDVSNIVARVVKLCHDGLHPVDAVGLEANAFQDLLAPEFDRQCETLRVPPLPIHLIHNTRNKQLRIARLGPYLARCRFRFRNTPGTRLLVEQLQEFPLAEHDDGPDAAELALRLLLNVAGERDELKLQGFEEL